MKHSFNTTIAPEIASNLINRLSLVGPFREDDAKSTFYVTPKLHRKLDLVCECTGLSRQEIYTKALRFYLTTSYLEDIDPQLFQTNIS